MPCTVLAPYPLIANGGVPPRRKTLFCSVLNEAFSDRRHVGVLTGVAVARSSIPRLEISPTLVT